MTVTDEREPDRDSEALACRRRAVTSEVLCLRRALPWVYIVIGALVIAVILAAVIR